MLLGCGDARSSPVQQTIGWLKSVEETRNTPLMDEDPRCILDGLSTVETLGSSNVILWTQIACHQKETKAGRR